MWPDRSAFRVSQSPNSAAAVVLSAPDGWDHAVDEVILAKTLDGRYLARCGRLVLSAALVAEPGRRCPLCFPRSRSTAQS
jgi:hypothetical protein